MHTILITGAGTGLGKELALAYAAQGHTIILTGRRGAPLQEAKEEIESRGGTAFSYMLDVSKQAEVQNVIKTITAQHPVSYLINNAGVGCFGPFMELNIADIDRAIATNVLGTIYLTKALLPHLLLQAQPKIMNIISTAGQQGKVNESVYVATKFAIRGFTESLQIELKDKIAVTATYMGGMATPFWDETDHVKDKSRLKSVSAVAEIIIGRDCELEINV